MEPSTQLIAKMEAEDPSVGSITYWSGNSHSRILLYSFWAGSAFSIIISINTENPVQYKFKSIRSPATKQILEQLKTETIKRNEIWRFQRRRLPNTEGGT